MMDLSTMCSLPEINSVCQRKEIQGEQTSPKFSSSSFSDFKFFTKEQMVLLDKERVPKHVAIIPDGNRRWAQKGDYPPIEGHNHGADILMDIVKSGIEIGIKTMTFYTFSTENWNRGEIEVAGLLWLLESYLSEKCEEMIEWGIKFESIGDLLKLPKSLQEVIFKTKEKTAHCEKIEMVLAVNYGSRDELTRAIRAIVTDAENNEIEKEAIDPRLISKYLDTSKWDDPELLIRTSGEMRVSNFLLWQLSYAEIYVSNVLWPDYKPYHLFEAIYNFQKRQRRLGGP